jgi:alpha-1,2-mannosyltransferase
MDRDIKTTLTHYPTIQLRGKMRIAAIHSSLNQFGGAERLCMIMVKTLQKAGNSVTLATVDKANWPLLKARYNLASEPDQELFMIPNAFQTASISQRVALTLSFFLAVFPLLKLKDKYDLLINTSGEIISLTEDVAYINAVPMRAAFSYPDVLPVRNSYWRCCSKVYDRLLKVIDRINNDSLLLTNSEFNKAAIERCFRRHASVIYPPVDLDTFKQCSGKQGSKDLIVIVSRFRPGKNLEYVPRVAKAVKNSRFLIIGPSDKTSRTTIHEINRSAKKLGVTEKIELITNPPLSVLLQVLSKAKVLLHTQFHEAFGISIVEAMAAGCVPVVPNDGGPWFDILEEKEGVYGFSYSSISEAAEKIRMLLENDELRIEVSARARRRAMDFDSSVFERKILDVVNKVCSQKLQ